MQSGFLWFRKLTDSIKEKGFEQSHPDPCLFRRIVDGKVVTLLVVYVDGILLASKKQRWMRNGPCHISVHASRLRTLGKAEFYLVCHITRNKEARPLSLDQHIYTENKAKRCNVTKNSMIPTATRVKPLPKEDRS